MQVISDRYTGDVLDSMYMRHGGGAEVHAPVEPRDPHWRHLRLSTRISDSIFTLAAAARGHVALDLVESKLAQRSRAAALQTK